MNAVIVGGGAAGMFAAALASEAGIGVTLIEQNEKLGKKLFITGKGRCNFTNDCTPEEFRSNVLTNPKFLFSASDALTSRDVIDLFESWGLRTKVERGRRAFPASDHSSDVIAMLEKRLKAGKVRVLLNTKVTDILTEDGRAAGISYVQSGRRGIIRADAVILATGGLSYPSTGACGDGYQFAKKLRLSVTKLYPSLVPFNCKEEYVKDLQGLSLKNVAMTVRSGKKEVFGGFGEMLFTHFGISGPLALSASARIGPLIGQKELVTRLDLKPAVSEEQLDARFVKVFQENSKKALKNVLHEFYPSKMQQVIPKIAGIDEETRCCDLTKEARGRLIHATKEFPLTIVSLRGFGEAVITKGGIAVKEIDPRTMEAKSCPGLYCIGEVLDLDAYTGGYNLQIAWCTAAACARALAEL